MAILALPVQGPAEAYGSDYSDCGTLAGDAVIQTGAPGASLPTLDDATAQQVADAINGLNIPGLTAVNEYPSDLPSYLAQWIGQGWYVMAGVRVDSWSCELDPNGTAEHWVSCYSDDGWLYNCWYAIYEQADLGTLQAAFSAAGTYVGVVRIKTSVATPSSVEDDEDMGYIVGWNWPEKNPPQGDQVLTSGDGYLIHQFWFFDGSSTFWDTEILPRSAPVIPGTLTKLRLPDGWHLYALLENGMEGHWWQPDGPSSGWGYQELPNKPGSGAFAVPVSNEAIAGLSNAVLAAVKSLPAATGGGLTTAQQQELDAVKAALATLQSTVSQIEKGLQGA